MILRVYAFIRALPEPFAWLSDRVEELADMAETGAFEKAPQARAARVEIEDALRLAAQTFETVTRFLAGNGFNRLAEKSAADAENTGTILAQAETGDAEGTAAALRDLKLTTLVATKAEKEAGWEEFKDAVSRRRSCAKDGLKALLPAYFTRSPGETAADIAGVLPFARTLEALVNRFHEIYSKVKRREGLIDFADFEHFALRILADEAVAASYRSRIHYLFVDEYQDSSPVQEALINRLKNPGSLFFVGVVKQSIYGFRNAEPGLFLDKYTRYPQEDREGVSERRIDLSENFRSKRGILDAANAVFERLMAQRDSGFDYDARARLRLGLRYDEKWDRKPVLHLLRKDRGKVDYENDAEGEAAVCARIIRETVGTVFYDAKAG
jgi:ATP-dependent helicase/nuclease subunit A